MLPEVYRLTTAASPHLAAERDGVEIDFEGLANAPRVGAGPGGRHRGRRRPAGAADAQPAADRAVRALGRAGRARRSTRLGTINHSLLSIEALKRRRIPLLGVAFVGDENADSRTHHHRDGRRAPPGPPADARSARRRHAARCLRRQLPRRRLSRPGAGMTSTGGSPIWHPFTQHGLQPRDARDRRARGRLARNRRRRAASSTRISSWWVVTHGHCHPRIVAAIEAQAGGSTR